MLCFPNCKINIGLYITNRRNDGYHDLETVFYPIKGFHDALEVMASEQETKLHVSGIEVEGDHEQNLVWKAYELLHQRFPAKVKNLDIYLRKALPMGAGLGGGSADGAFMLQLLNDYCKLGLEKDLLAELALQLGSDCPFFIHNTPQFAKGRGEQLSPMPMLDLSGYSIQLICPEVHISTKEAFSMITPRAALYDLRTLADLPISKWKDHIHNDFEDAIFMQHADLAAIKRVMYAQGAIYAAMSGSGSTIYGIFEKGQKAVIETPLKYKEHYTN